MSSISRDEWLTALGVEQRRGDPDALTVMELAALIGLKRSATQTHVRRLVSEGKMRPTLKRITDNQGRPQLVSAYVLVKARKKAT